MRWTTDAEELLKRVPFFVKRRVIKRVEEEAVSLGAELVTVDHVYSCRNRFMNKMEDEVKGFQVEACFGSGDCQNCTVNITGMIEQIEKSLSDENIKGFLKEKVKGPLKLHHEFRVSISGCPNACSRPQIADIGVIAVSVPEITEEKCSLCGECEDTCREEAISFISDRPVIDKSKCLLCGQCISVCPAGVITEGGEGCRMMIGGKLGRHPRLALDVPGIFNMEETAENVKRFIGFYKGKCLNGERFGEVLGRNGIFDLNQGSEVISSILYGVNVDTGG